MAYLALSASFEYLCYGSTAIRNILILSARGLSLYTLESDIYRRQKDGPVLKGLKSLVWPFFFYLFCTEITVIIRSKISVCNFLSQNKQIHPLVQ